MLYLVATPIGNLSDISFRAIEILKSCEYILCEDTRHSRILLQNYQIKTPLKSYHQFNEASLEDSIVHDLQANKNIALISDAGTPAISDPGERLVKKCIELDLQVSPIPGPCAAISALICSGFETIPFQFLGFLPNQASEKKEVLRGLIDYLGTSIIYESPHKLNSLLEELKQLIPDRAICICREITKKFETFYYGSVEKLCVELGSKTLKGEFVIVIDRNHTEKKDWQSLSIEQHVAFMMETYQLTKKEAIQSVANLRGLPKKNVYQKIHIPDSSTQDI